MDKRGYPFDSGDPSGQRQQAMSVQMAQALEMEEALYLQRQQEFGRDIQLQRLLLQEQLQQGGLSNHLASLHASRLFYGGGLGGGGLAAQYEQELLLQQQEQMRRQQQQQLQQQLQNQQSQKNEMNAEQMVADSLAANAIRRSAPSNPGPQRKRSVDKTAESSRDIPPAKRPARKDSVSSEKVSIDHQNVPKNGSGSGESEPKKPATKRPRKSKKQQDGAVQCKRAKTIEETTETVAIEALTAVGNDLSPAQFVPIIKGTVESLLSAAADGEKVDLAAETMANFKQTVREGDLDDAPDYEQKEMIALPNFKSFLPLLPSEPEYNYEDEESKGDPMDESLDSRMKSSSLKGVSSGSKAGLSGKAGALAMTVEYPYPVDTWWPSISSIRKERRAKGEKSDEEDFDDTPVLSSESEVPLRADLDTIHLRLATQSEPGVLEKVPHCRIHRMAMKSQKVANAPDHAFCWQVTENYCNDPMVCCSICSSWRHARCGGHYKPMTIRDMTVEAFVPVCDRCHVEQEILAEYPQAATRIERQRIEQLRRALSTSHVIRQASFAKHGSTYKWPLGSVLATHIGGHTRSVHSRHDKAEKQWSEMVTRLARASGYRPKERVKVRTRELERLLVSIEDSEGVTDRHNMMLFLLQDSNREKPVGYEKQRINIFDPEDDEVPPEFDTPDLSSAQDHSSVELEATTLHDDEYGCGVGRRVSAVGKPVVPPSIYCLRGGCSRRPRFDSVFCSDACGVTALQTDLLHAFYYANDIHPSLLRS